MGRMIQRNVHAVLPFSFHQKSILSSLFAQSLVIGVRLRKDHDCFSECRAINSPLSQFCPGPMVLSSSPKACSSNATPSQHPRRTLAFLPCIAAMPRKDQLRCVFCHVLQSAAMAAMQVRLALSCAGQAMALPCIQVRDQSGRGLDAGLRVLLSRLR